MDILNNVYSITTDSEIGVFIGIYDKSNNIIIPITN